MKMAAEENIDHRGDESLVRSDIDVMPVTKSSYIMSHYPQIIYQKHTFFSALAMGLSALGVAFIFSCTAVVIYGMYLAGEKPDRFVSLAEDAIRFLPALQKSLPPVLADTLNDYRRPDYGRHLEIAAETKPLPESNGRLRSTVKVVNHGQETVSLLSLRIVVLDSQGQILAESNEWAATPVTAEPHWQGPLMPGFQRHLAFSCSGTFPVSSLRGLKTEVEITDIRIWSGQKETWLADSQPPPHVK
jgi:hypothetical protein